MTEMEFIESNNYLEKFFEKELTEFQRKTWYEELKYIPVRNYKNLVREAIKTYKYLPKLSEMLLLKSTVKMQEERTEQVHTKCDLCNGSGLIRFTRKVENGPTPLHYEYVARCKCENAKNFEWKDKESGRFIIPSAVELRLI